MVNEEEQRQLMSPSDEIGFAKSQIEQSLETFRASISLLTQIITLLVLADVTVVGYAMSTQVSGILFIGALFPLMIYYMFFIVNRLIFPMVYTAVSLEHKYGGDKSDWLATTFLGHIASQEYVTKLRTISALQDVKERNRQLRAMSLPLFGSGRGFTRAALVLSALSHNSR
ncbi:MAG: hypothetical protein HY327_09185 [Chloroflexi bacterium]|nr:hypothetical protein [Chloroflexota bacterium]